MALGNPLGKRRRRLEQPAGVGELGTFRGISSHSVDLILQRVRANPSILHEGPQSYKWASQRNRDKLKADLGMYINVPLLKNCTFSWGVLQPARLLQHYSSVCRAYRDLLQRARANYAGKWTLVIYEDEIQPGNAFLNRRKLHAWYFSFRQFDQGLRDENAWICFAVLQSCIVENVLGGFSAVSKLVHQALFTLQAPNFSVGVAISHPRPDLITVDLDDLQDADALKYKWDIKGHGGMKPCALKCANVFMKNHSAKNKHPDFVDICDLDWNRVKNFQATDLELWSAQDELVGLLDVRGASERRKKLEMAYGQNANKHGLLSCKELRPYVKPSRSSYDPMHCLFSNGIADIEITLLCGKLKELKFDFQQINSFVNTANSGKKLQLASDGVKGMATECLRAVPLLRYFLVKCVQPHGVLADEIASFCALADVVRQFQRCKLYNKVPDDEADKLQSLMATHADAFKKAWGKDLIVPKHHYTMHLPQQIKRHGIVMDCFACERKNKLPKEVVEHYRFAVGTAHVELHVVAHMNLLQLEDMDRLPSAGQVYEPSERVGEFVVAKKARLHFGAVEAGQAFLANGCCYILQACVTNDAAGLILIAKKYAFVASDAHPAVRVWRDSGEVVSFATDDSSTCKSTCVC